MSMQIKLTEIVFDQSIYPRSNYNENTVDDYVTAMNLGAVFPPLLVQSVQNGQGNKYVIIDGVHRFHAYKKLGAEQVEVSLLWDKTANLETDRLSLLLISAEKNTDHGDRLSNKDKQVVARIIAKADPEKQITEKDISDKLKVARQSVNNWISDIRASQNASRESVISRLSALGFTQEAIAGKVGIDQSVVSRIMQNANFGNLHNFLQQGHPLEKALEVFGLDYPMAYSILFEGKDDHDRFKELNWGLRTWDYWNWNDCDQRFGEDWPGRIPAQLVAHALYYFTNQGDRVFDPMAGGGVVPDTCLAFNRKCNAFDLSTRKERPEIENHYWKVGGMEWPDVKKPDLIFFDPPYYTKMERDYAEKATDETPPISSLDRAAYIEFFREFFTIAKENTDKGARFAFLNADWRDFQSKDATSEDPGNSITIFHYRDLLESTGWQITHRIECPMSTDRMGGNTVKHMQARRTIGTINRTLLIAKRV